MKTSKLLISRWRAKVAQLYGKNRSGLSDHGQRTPVEEKLPLGAPNIGGLWELVVKAFKNVTERSEVFVYFNKYLIRL